MLFELFKKIFNKEDISKKIKSAPVFDVDFNNGLNNEQIKQRNKDGLSNSQIKEDTNSYFKIILKSLFSNLTIILFVLAIILCYFGLYKRLLFLILLFTNIFIDLFQNFRAFNLTKKLSLINNNSKISVIRNGFKKEINFNELVLSDIIVLKSGCVVPNDSEVVYGSVFVNESLLTGESIDIEKKVGDQLYAKSIINSGFCYVKATKIANANYIVKLQEKLRSFSRPKSQILNSLKIIIRVTTLIAFTICFLELLFYTNFFKNINKDIVDSISSSFLSMLSIGMYTTISISFASASINLLKKFVLVNEPYAIEMLARTNVICLDKTGTLTTGEMNVKNLIPVASSNEEYLKNIIGYIISATESGNLTSRALKNHYEAKKINGDYTYIPFNSKNKYSAVSFDGNVYALGAYGFINIKNDKDVKEIVDKYEKSGFRVLLIAEKKGEIIDNQLSNNLAAIGVLVLGENIRNSAKSCLKFFKANDIDVRIISGDSANFLKVIAKEMNLENFDKVISLHGLSDEEVRNAVPNYTIFARSDPKQKKIIIDELKRQKKTVSMVGDGINDLLALKSANCSIAMANEDNIEATRTVSNIVLLNSNFNNVNKIIYSGKKIINNLQRICSIFLTKVLFTIFVSSFFLLISEKFPYRVNDLYIWEIFSVGLSPLLLSFESNNKDINNNFLRNIIKEILPAGLIQAFICIFLFMFQYFFPAYFSYENFLSTSILAVTFMSIVLLFFICKPINSYRALVLVINFSLMTFSLFLDYKFNLLTGIKYYNLNLYSLVGVFIFFLLFLSFPKIHDFFCFLIEKK